jgi:hypothetical protein
MIKNPYRKQGKISDKRKNPTEYRENIKRKYKKPT